MAGLLHLWEEGAHGLRRSFLFSSFTAGIAFVNDVAAVAENQHHHPHVTVDYTCVTLTVNTHDAGGAVTAKDHKLASAVDALYLALKD